MKPLIFNVEEGIDAICHLLPTGDTRTRNGLIEIAYKLATGKMTSGAISAWSKDGEEMLLVIGNTKREQLVLIKQLEDQLLMSATDLPVETESAEILPFPPASRRGDTPPDSP